MTPISKNLFVKCVNSMANLYKFQCEVICLTHKYNPMADMGVFDYPSCDDQLLQLLTEVMRDDEGLIAEYLYSSKPIVTTVDELWDMLNNKGGK